MKNTKLESGKLQNSAVWTMAKLFYSSYYVGLNDDSCMEIYTEVDQVHDALGEKGSAREKVKIFCDTLVLPQYKEMIRKISDIDTLGERLKNKESISCEYEGLYSGWSELIILVVDRDANNNPLHVLFLVRLIEEEKRHQLEQAKILLNSFEETKSSLMIERKAFDEIQEVLGSGLWTMNLYSNKVIKNCNWSKSFREMLGYTSEIEFPNEYDSWVNILHEDDKEIAINSFFDVLNNYPQSTIVDVEYRLLIKDEGYCWFRTVGKISHTINDEYIFFGVLVNINAKKNAEHNLVVEKKKSQRLLEKSHTDNLTGMGNREAYEYDIKMLSEQKLEDDCVFVSFDLNGLKVINDTLGHSAGDELIRGASECISDAFGEYGNIYRIGGDEFVGILYMDVITFGERIRYFDSEVKLWSGIYAEEMSISYGYALGDENNEYDIMELANIADDRMYKAKAQHYLNIKNDLRGKNAAMEMLYLKYTKILCVDLIHDVYQVIESDDDSFRAVKFSEGIKNMVEAGIVHEDDQEAFLQKLSVEYIKEYFDAGNTLLDISYTRKVNGEFRKVFVDIIPTAEYDETTKNVFIYLKKAK